MPKPRNDLLVDRIKPLTVTRAGIAGTIVVLIVAAACVRLGFWQLSRLQERTSRNQLLERRMELPALQLQGALGDTAGLAYRRARLSGPYDHDGSIVLAGRALRGAPGAYLLTPVLLGAGRAVLVNRGWVPAADGSTVYLDSLRGTPEARLVGLILPFPGSGRRKPPPGAARDSAFRRTWFSPDPDAIRRQYHDYALLPIHVQALPDDDAERFPIRLPPPILDRGPHIGYAIQWFSFAVIALVGWTILMIRNGELRTGGRS